MVIPLLLAFLHSDAPGDKSLHFGVFQVLRMLRMLRDLDLQVLTQEAA